MVSRGAQPKNTLIGSNETLMRTSQAPGDTGHRGSTMHDLRQSGLLSLDDRRPFSSYSGHTPTNSPPALSSKTRYRRFFKVDAYGCSIPHVAVQLSASFGGPAVLLGRRILRVGIVVEPCPFA